LGIRGVVSSKKLSRDLYDKGVLLHPDDMLDQRLGVAGKTRLELSKYAVFDLGDGFDPESMMEDAIDSDLDPSVFSDMDIRELDNPPNFFEYVTGRKYLNTTIFPRQFQIQLGFFEEFCPWCSDKEFVKDIHLSPYPSEDGIHRRPWTNDEILSKVTLYQHGKCPKCKRTYIDAFNDPRQPHRFPKEVDACIGQRGGKTRMTEHMMSYNETRFHLLSPSPQQFFGEDATQKFSAIYTALEMTQAQDTLWGAYHLRVLAAPWWHNYHKWLDHHGKRLGVELYRIKETYHFYANTLLHSVLRPPFAKKMRGRTSFDGGIDEIGMFAKREGSIVANADEVHKSIGNSLMTLRGKADQLLRRGVLGVPAPALFCISSPWELLDKIMTLVRTVDKDPTRVAYHYPTWDFNPNLHRDDPQMEAEFLNDPVAAERDFGAIPPFAKDPFHPVPDAIDYLEVPALHQVFIQQIKYCTTKSGKRLVYAVPLRMQSDHVTPRLLCLDAGESDNSFALTLWRLVDLPAPPADTMAESDDDDDDDEDIRVVMAAIAAEKHTKVPGDEHRGRVTYMQLDGAIEVQPFVNESGYQYRVSFSKMWKYCIEPIIRAFNLVGVIGDRWNITQIMNSIEELGVYTEQYSLVWSDFLAFKEKTSARELRLPSPERPFTDVYTDYDKAVRGAPILHLVVQYKTVRQVGRTVTKPPSGTDDLYRTMVLAHRFAFSEKAVKEIDGREISFFELLHREGKMERVNRAVSVIMLHGGSGSSSPMAQVGGGFTRLGGYVSRGGAAGGVTGGNSYSNVATHGGKGGDSPSTRRQ